MTTQNNNNIPKGYKNSPLGVIPEEWEVKSIKDTFETVSSYSYSRDQMTDRSQLFMYIHYGDIHKNEERDNIDLKKTVLPFLIDEAVKGKNLITLKNGDIILADASEDYNGVGNSVEIIDCDNQDIIAGLHTIALRPSGENVYTGFGRYIFRSDLVKKNLERVAQGTKVYSISYKHISPLELPLPPLPEQQRIATLLGVWDTAIEKQTKLVAALQTRKRALMQQLLTGKKRLPGFVGEWEKVKLGEVFEERNETNCQNLSLLSIGQEGVYLQSESAKKDTSNDDKSKYKRICPNDIGYNTMRMWQGRSALSSLEGIVSPAYTIVIPNPKVDAFFMSVLLKQKRVVYDFWTHSHGLVRDTLNCKYRDFSQVKVLLPTLSEQTVIASVLTTADKEIRIAENRLQYLREQKKGLMQVLLTGKKRVKN